MARFEVPTQVKFYDADSGMFQGGIAYGDEIICGCCGGIFEVDEVIEGAKRAGVDLDIRIMSWVDISEEILG